MAMVTLFHELHSFASRNDCDSHVQGCMIMKKYFFKI